MKLDEILEAKATEIIDDALESLRCVRLKSYDREGGQETRDKLTRLYALTREAIATRNLTALIRHAAHIAGERHSSGFELRETQTAFNALEEAIWRRLMKELPPEEIVEALGLVSTALGMGKDRLACAWVQASCGVHSPTLDQRALFQGVSA